MYWVLHSPGFVTLLTYVAWLQPGRTTGPVCNHPYCDWWKSAFVTGGLTCGGSSRGFCLAVFHGRTITLYHQWQRDGTLLSHTETVFPFSYSAIVLGCWTVEIIALERVLEVKYYSLSLTNNRIVASCHLLSSYVPGAVLMMCSEIDKHKGQCKKSK